MITFTNQMLEVGVPHLKVTKYREKHNVNGNNVLP